LNQGGSGYPRISAIACLLILPDNEYAAEAGGTVTDMETRRVQIVDDDTLLRGLCALALRPVGYDLQEAECGEDAVESFTVSVSCSTTSAPDSRRLAT
jgi:hypothetical protein